MAAVAFQRRSAAPRVSGYERFALQNLGLGLIHFAPRWSHLKGSREAKGFPGTGDIIEGYTMEEIPR